MISLWFNLGRFIIRRLDQFTDNYGAPLVTNSQICDAVLIVSPWFFLKITWDYPWTIVTVYASRRIIFSLSILPEIRINCSLEMAVVWLVGLQYFQSLLFFWKKKIKTETKYEKHENKTFLLHVENFCYILTFSYFIRPPYKFIRMTTHYF